MNYSLKIDKIISKIREKKVLIITTSNRWGKEVPKSTQLAKYFLKKIGKNAKLIDSTKLNIHPCEGNVSTSKGNLCGMIGARLKDKQKNPSGFHRCWASINNKDDELWKITKELFEVDVVLFFSSVRWGQTNAYYQKLIERLTFIENRHTTLGEENILKNKQAGLILFGHNWNVEEVLKTQRAALRFYGFEVPKELFFSWKYTTDSDDETREGYKKAIAKFEKEFGIK
jgi:multimeric flavodoxin WrbA